MKNFLLLLLSLLASSLSAIDIPDPMNPPRLVNDFANIFSPSQKIELEQTLKSYNDSTSTQIYVVSVADLQGYAASDFAVRLGEKWGVGQKGKNNGAVILIKPKKGNSRGDVYIAVGYGLEPILNDGRIGRIIDNDMIPYLQKNDYYNGTQSAINTMIKYLSGQFEADEEEEESWIPFISMIILTVGAVIVISLLINRNNKGNGSSNGGGFPPIFPGGFGGGFGSGSGGNFGGGGGGSFGGGGAGRSW